MRGWPPSLSLFWRSCLFGVVILFDHVIKSAKPTQASGLVCQIYEWLHLVGLVWVGLTDLPRHLVD
jgi:hypothetical protein